MDETLSPRQREVLDYLSGCNHATRNTMRRSFGGAVPGVSLNALVAKGYVTATPSAEPFSTNVRYEITAEGRRAVGG